MFIANLSNLHFDGWNIERLTELDALVYCRSHRIYVVTDHREHFGRLVYYKNYTFILINPTLDAGTRLWVLWHEIGHYILHYPNTAQFSASMRRKNDYEANFVAAVAMMPAPLIAGYTIDEVVNAFGYPPEIVKIRYEIANNERI